MQGKSVRGLADFLPSVVPGAYNAGAIGDPGRLFYQGPWVRGMDRELRKASIKNISIYKLFIIYYMIIDKYIIYYLNDI
jgi:hypothetical protein